MSHKFLQDASFHFVLKSIDQDLAKGIQQQGCPRCGGALHHSDYPRSPCGVSPPFRKYYEDRLSFCCCLCRKRITPPSVRFFGRRWFPAPLLTLVSALDVGINEWRCDKCDGISASWFESLPGNVGVDGGEKNLLKHPFGNKQEVLFLLISRAPFQERYWVCLKAIVNNGYRSC